MALASQVLDHDTPSAPTRANGMLLGSTGVNAPRGQVIGGTSGTSSADGSFSDFNGYGQIDYDSAGRMYIADSNNARVQCFTKIAGVWTYHSKVSNAAGALVGGSACSLLSIDRSVTPNQIHIAAYDSQVDGTWISVWSVSDWPNLTSGNRLRRYGSNALSDASGKAYRGLSLQVDGTYAIVTSLFSPYRTLRWNHLTGALANEETQGSQYAKWATDGAGNWWTVARAGASEVGLWSHDPATLTGITRYDAANVGTNLRRDRFANATPINPVYVAGRIYVREVSGRILAWNAATEEFIDEFAAAGALGGSDVFSGYGAHQQDVNVYAAKSGAVVDADGCAWLVAWASNADNTSTSQSYLVAWPLTTATATWTKNDWSSGTNTIKAIAVQGAHVAAEKIKVRLRKGSGSWTTVTAAQLADESVLDFETFTGSDVLTVELSLSTGDRQDGTSGLTFARDKLSPSEVSLKLYYEDTAGDVYVPYPSAGFKGRVGTQGAYKGRIGV